ncbi:ABC transporter C family member 13 [Linum perenne]
MEEPLLSVDDVEQALPPPPPDSLPKENAQSLWDLMTFESIAPVMNHGITKQLNFKDLLSLPDDMEPSVCHSVLISCWQAQESRPNPFLLKAIFYAYGWPYLKLGLLKVINDGLGFVGPLLLNKLIHFLQEVNKWISELIASATEKMMKQKDERIRRTGEILSHIRTLKMYGWEQLFSNWVMDTRILEVKHLATRKYLDAWCVFFWAATPTLFSLCTFGLFSLMGYQLDAATAYISTRRLSRFLRCSGYKHEKNVISSNDCSPKDIAVVLHDACCAWSSSDERPESTVLYHVNLSLPKGALIAVTGEVGSGKSSLLGAILGEMQLISGSIHSSGTVAYVPQVPWILAGTIRENIVFGKHYDSKRYFDTIKVCALDVDISLMAGGDMACIGEQGLNLSGGQRARLALARAIYQGSDLYLLDDVLSAVDSHVAWWILHNAILGPLTNQATRILCTHNIQAISCADLVIVMDKGQVKWAGSSVDLIVLCVFCASNSFLTLVRAFSFSFGGLRAAVQVHNILLDKLLDAPVQFFDQTPSGRILNRFSSDLYTIDDSLPFMLNILVANFVGLLGIAMVLSYVQVFFLLLLLPFWLIYSKLQNSFQRNFTEHVTLYQRTSYSETIASLWLSLRLQLLGAFVVTFVAVMAVAGSRGYLPIDFGTPGLVGLALSYASPIVTLLGNFLTSFTETEKEMVSIERALEYMDIPQEVLEGPKALDPNWPFDGLIKFQNVTMRYMPSLPPALRDVTFTIAGGTQVGIIGRTGAGKSSILNALFRLSLVSSGCILVDALNILDVPVRDLRSRLAVVPQIPFLFQGSLRDNLDPLRKSNDLKIWDVLGKCHVKDEVETAGGLDILVQASGCSFSTGQRQLLCLARALLKSSKILCLDECTANVDTQTAKLLQNTISSECKGMTVITIAHRISTVLNMDQILILEQGKLVEQGNPQALLEDGSSNFSSFAKASTM